MCVSFTWMLNIENSKFKWMPPEYQQGWPKKIACNKHVAYFSRVTMMLQHFDSEHLTLFVSSRFRSLFQALWTKTTTIKCAPIRMLWMKFKTNWIKMHWHISHLSIVLKFSYAKCSRNKVKQTRDRFSWNSTFKRRKFKCINTSQIRTHRITAGEHHNRQ